MKVEIERKFLLKGDAWRQGPGIRLVQCYLRRDANLTVRVRVAGPRAFLTIKGTPRELERMEFEYEIPLREAEMMMEMCDSPPVEKIRREIVHEGFRWEVDEFLGANQGLCIAELELDHPETNFPLPPWVGTEVTGDPRYYNACLAVRPFTSWPDANG